jgi:pSer/pThr/pTyr-binding forkhead associated (FHA) protein
MPRLTVKLPGGTKTVPVGDEAVSIGRTSDNTLPLEGEGVSRKHAQILFVGKGYEIVDLGSRNGTKVNGQKVPRALLKHGDVIGVGPIDMVFEEDGAAAAGGVEIEELDIGAAQSAAPSPGSATSTMAMQAGAGGPPGECVLRFSAGEKAGTDLPLKAVRATFGRRSSNTVSFQDSSVSGVHCEITREANGYVLRDLGSTNGTLVDGEPVVEVILHHNARIRIGAQRLVFVDPTVADIESTLAAGDEHAEWGVLRGEIDAAAAAGRRGGAGVLAALGLTMVVLGGAGFWVWKTRPVHVEVEGVKDNRVADWSFEDGVVRWFSQEEEGATSRILGTPEAPKGASGAHCLEVVPKGDGPGLVEFSGAAKGESDTTVTPDAAYEVSARVGSGEGAVVVTWVSSSRPGLVREDSTPVVPGAAGWPETKVVLTAPAHATEARLGLAAFGGRPASFDDVVFRRAAAPAAPVLESGDLRARIDVTGSIEAVRQGEVLITEGGLAPSADATPESLLGASLDAPPAHTGSALQASGRARGGAAFDVKVEAAAGGAVLSCVPKGGGGGCFAFTCPGALPRGAVTLVLEKTALPVPEDETFRMEGVRKVILGGLEGAQPFLLSAPKDSPGFAWSSRRTARGLRVALAPPAGVEGAPVLLSVDLRLEEQAADEKMKRARDLRSQGKLGAAAAAFENVELEYHYMTQRRDEARKEKDAILVGARDTLARAARKFAGAKRYRSLGELQEVAADCDRLGADFDGTDLGAKAKDLAEKSRAALQEVALLAAEAETDHLFQRYNDYKAGGNIALAITLGEEILRVAPKGNDYRARIEQDLPKLREDVEKQQREQFGARK